MRSNGKTQHTKSRNEFYFWVLTHRWPQTLLTGFIFWCRYFMQLWTFSSFSFEWTRCWVGKLTHCWYICSILLYHSNSYIIITAPGHCPVVQHRQGVASVTHLLHSAFSLSLVEGKNLNWSFCTCKSIGLLKYTLKFVGSKKKQLQILNGKLTHTKNHT